MSFWTDVRNAVESVASVAGNYFYPGSGLVTSQLVSEGSQQQLGSTIGQVAMVGSGLGGGLEGNMSNYGSTYNAITGSSDPQSVYADLIKQGVDPAQAAAMANSGTTGSASLGSLVSNLGSGVTPGDIGNWAAAGGGPLTAPSTVAATGAGATGSLPWGSTGNLLQTGTSLYGLYESQQMQAMAKQLQSSADPFAPYRAQYAQQMSALSANPSLITQQPGYQAGQQAVQRAGAAQGYTGSGNMAVGLQQYAGDFYNQTMQQYAGYAGANANPASAAQLALSASGMGANLALNSAGLLTKTGTMASGAGIPTSLGG